MAKELYHDSFRLSRKRLFATQREMSLDKGLNHISATIFSCMIHSDRRSQLAVNELPTFSASM